MKIVEYSKGSITEVENVFKVVESGAQGPQGPEGIIDTLDTLDSKATPIDADLLLVGDSTDSFANKSTTWANIKATLKAFFDLIYQPLATALGKITESGGLPLWDGGDWPGGVPTDEILADVETIYSDLLFWWGQSDSEIDSYINNLFSSEVPADIVAACKTINKQQGKSLRDAIDLFKVMGYPGVLPDVTTLTAKSVIFDFASNHGDPDFLGVRSLEFYNEGVLIGIITEFTAYATSQASSSFLPGFAFNTSLSKTGASSETSWAGASGSTTNQRLIVVFDAVQTFDSIVSNNYSTNNVETDVGVNATKITISDDAITDTTYGAAIANSTLIFDDVIPEHNGSAPDDQTLTLTPALSIGAWGHSYIDGSPDADQEIQVYIEDNTTHTVNKTGGTPGATLATLNSGLNAYLAAGNYDQVILMGGLNDIGVASSDDSTAWAALVESMCDKVVADGGTPIVIGPGLFKGYTPYWTADRQIWSDNFNAKLTTLTTDNGWGFVELKDSILADDIDPDRFETIYDSGDHIHPSDLGYQWIGAQIIPIIDG